MKQLELSVINLHELDPEKQQEAAEWVANYTQTVGFKQYNMLRLTAEQVHRRMGNLALVGGALAGYMGASEPEDGPQGKMSEIGSLFVLEEYQKHGIASALTKKAVETLVREGVVPYIFCNANSLHIAESVGFEPASANELPDCATDACGGCSAMLAGLVKPGQCCDTMMIYNGGQQNE